MEEPPPKVTKFEMDSQYSEGDMMDEGQEEWLSEGVLTDDDYNPTSQHTVGDQSGSNPADSQDETMASTSADDSQMETQQLDSQQQIIIQQIDDQQCDNQHITIQQVDDQEMDNKHILQGLDSQHNIVFEGLGTQRFVIQQTGGNQGIVIHQLDDQQMDDQQMDDQQFVIQQVGNKQLKNSQTSSNIEETLNNFENAKNYNQAEEPDLPAELSTFLTRKSKPGRTGSDETKDGEDDGNDTDDLLRVLGDGDQKATDREKKGNHGAGADSTDDDDSYIFQKKKSKNYQAAKNTLRRAAATKALPEDDITDCSSDEASKPATTTAAPNKTTSPTKQNAAPKITTNVKPGLLTITPPTLRKKLVKQVVDVGVAQIPKTGTSVEKNASTKQYANKRLSQGSSIVKENTTKIVQVKKEMKPSPKEMEDYLTEDAGVDTNEKIKAKSSEVKKPKQRIMRPEMMDEEVPTDAESDDDEDCLYDELPSSESEDQIDWFTLDIRAERAGDYLPLLGDRAYELLLEEKQRVAEKLESLKNSLRVLTDNGREQAEKLRQASHTAAELDAMLRAT